MPSLSLGEIARRLDAELRGDPDVRVDGVAPAGEAGPGDVAVVADQAGLENNPECAAGAVLSRGPVEGLPCAQIICDDLKRALGLLLELFTPEAGPHPMGIDPRAAVDDAAVVDATAWVGPFCYVGPGAVVGAHSRIEPFTYVGQGARVGHGCTLGPGATLLGECAVGDEVVLGPGAVVGHHGFGYWQDEDGWHRVPSRGTVTIADGAELGANTCVDRATLAATAVGPGVKIDNLVQVGHNSVIGQRALLCGQTGLAGSVTLGDGAVLAGQVGVADHRTVGEGARVGAGSGVVRDVPAGEDVSGYPAVGHGEWLRSAGLVRRLGELVERVRVLEARLGERGQISEEQEEEN